MTARGFIAAVLMAAMASTVQAQTVTVQSGEHAGFSRLVLNFGDRPAWRLGRQGGDYVLLVESPEVAYEVGGVFDLIPRTRILEVSQTGRGAPLTVKLGCVCHAEAFEVQDFALVIDIKDGSPPDNALYETPPDPFSTQTPTQPIAGQPDPDGPLSPLSRDLAGQWLPTVADDTRILVPTPLGTPRRQGTTPPAQPVLFLGSAEDGETREAGQSSSENEVSAPLAADTAAALMPELFPARRGERPGALDAIASELGRASAQGLIGVSPDLVGQRPGNDRAASRAPGSPASRQLGNIRIRTGLDPNLDETGLDRLLRQTEPGCISDRRLDVGAWGDAKRLGKDIGAYRGETASEFGEPEADALTALVRHYIFLTFGHEALALIRTYPGVIRDEQLLWTLARLVEQEPVSDPHAFSGQVSCATAAALWAFLALPADAVETPVPRVVVGQFGALPLHIRRHLASDLVERLRSADQSDAALEVLGSVSRAPGPHGEAVEFHLADMAASGERATKGADVPLDTFLGAEPQLGAAAALSILETALEEDRAIAPGSIADAAAFAFEFRHLPLGRDLKRAEIRALAASGRFGEAVTALRHAISAEYLSADEEAALAADMLAYAIDAASAGEFAVLVARITTHLNDATPQDVDRATAAARAYDLGLAELAEGLYPRALPALDELSLARARFSLRQSDFAAALEDIAGVAGPSADQIRREAQSQLGPQTGDSDDVERAAVPGRLVDEAPEGPEIQSAAADDPASLIDASRRTRDSLEAMLDASVNRPDQ